MEVRQELDLWVARQPVWRQRLFAACSTATGPLDDAALAVLLDEALLEGDHPSGVPTDLPLTPEPHQSEPVRLRALRPSAVNALIDGQELRFATDGITLLYGANGAGKSGYARVLKWAGRSGAPEEVHPHVVTRRPPSAELDVCVGGRAETVALDFVGPRRPGAPLLHAFDAAAGNGLVVGDHEVDYVPASVRGLERMAVACRRMGALLQARIDTTAIPAPPPGSIAPDTEAGRLVAGMSASTDSTSLRARAALSVEEQARRARLTRDVAEIASSRAGELRAAAERSLTSLRALWSELQALEHALDASALQEALADGLAEEVAVEASEAAARALEGMPLTGVGSDAWRLMWTCAGDYGQQVGGCALPHPAGKSGARCPLCMQELGEEAVRRLESLEAYVLDDVTAKLDAIRRRRAERGAALVDVDVLTLRHSAALAVLAERGAGAELAMWLERARQLTDAVRDGELDASSSPLGPPPDAARAVGEALATEAREHAALQRTEQQAALAAELAELDARAALAEHIDILAAAVDAHRQIERLREALPRLETRSISTVQTRVMRVLVDGDLQGHLERHLRALGFKGMKVRCRTRTSGGTSLVRLQLLEAEGAALHRVLSTGEQRRLALSFFLAEVEVLDLPLPLVFDDPVCSLDQEGRRHIATVLTEFAEGHQVVLLTHDLPFCMALSARAEEHSVDVSSRTVLRNAGSPGLLRDELPWEGLKASQRVQPLRAQLVALRELEQADDGERLAQAISHFCNCLRQAFERCVEEDVMARVISRGDPAVKTGALDNVNVSAPVRALVDRGMSSSSVWVHDRSQDLGADQPTADELAEGLDVLEQLLKVLKADKSASGQAASARQKGRLARLAAELTLPGGEALAPAPPIVDPAAEPSTPPRRLEDELGPLGPLPEREAQPTRSRASQRSPAGGGAG